MIEHGMPTHLLLGSIVAVLAFVGDDAWLTDLQNGHLHYSQGRFREAQASYRKAVQKAEIPGSDQKAIATARNGLGMAYFSLQESRHAEAEFRRSLAAFEAADPGKPESARVLLNLATSLSHQRRIPEAEEAIRQATVLLERAFGPDHPDVALSLISRGKLLLQISQCREAAVLFERARNLAAPNSASDPVTSSAILHNLGIARLCLGDYVEARHLIGLALDRRELTLPSGHPGIAQSLYAYGQVLEKTGRHKEARNFKKRANSILARHESDNLIGHTVDVSGWR